jgi:hypothetical protein
MGESADVPRSADLPRPPADLPEGVVSELQRLDVHELREAIVYAQELLQFSHEPTEQIVPSPGEEIVELTEHEGHTTVVKREPCGNDCEECPHGPYVYRVTRERNPDGEERYHWSFIGQTVPEES